MKRVLIICLLAGMFSLVPATASSAEVPGLPFTDTTCQEHSDSVARLYSAGLGRTADKAGFEYWLAEYRTARWTLPRMAEFFSSSNEFRASYGALSDRQFVEQVYRNVLNREGDVGGVAFWSGEIAKGTSRGTILLRFSESPENITRTGTAQPALGPYNEGVTAAFLCRLPSEQIATTPANNQTSAPSSPQTTTPTTPKPTTPKPAPEPASLAAVERVRAQLSRAEVVRSFPASTNYDRDDYDGRGYADDDGDCINARHETLILESVVQTTMNASGCSVVSGRWVDPYNGAVFTQASQVQIDHVVPLAHAHRAGAWEWSGATKRAFNSDIGHDATLAVTGASSNSSKGDRAPDAWKPSDRGAWCAYAIDWIDIKTRWELPYTSAEAGALDDMLDTCTSTTVRDRSSVGPAVASIAVQTVVPPAPKPTPKPAPAPTPAPPAPTPAPAPSAAKIQITQCLRSAEIVTIKNTGGSSITLTGHRLHDEGDKHSFNLSGITLGPNKSIDIISGRDPVAGPGQVIGWKNNIWNNDGDVASVKGPSGLVASKVCTG